MVTIRDMEKEAERGCNIFDAADQLRDYVYGLTRQAFERQQSHTVNSVQEVERWKQTVREQFLQAIGWDKGENSPLNACVTGVLSCEGYRIEKVVFSSASDVWVCANLYLPEGDFASGEKLPAVLLVCGHDPQGKQAAEYQRVCIYLVKAGMAVLCMDSCGQGERSGYYEEALARECIGRCTREHDYEGFQCMLLGDSVAKYLVRDAMRAVDYLIDRPEIDKARIGITGNSGGGTLTMMMMAADERLSAAAPGTFVTDREAYLASGQPQDNEQIWPGLTAAGIDHRDMILCMAPKPVLLLAAEHDFFPGKGTERTYAWCKEVWKLYGKDADLALYRDDCMHTYSEGMARRAAAFFAECFGIERFGEWSEVHVNKLLKNPQELWCTESGYLQNEKNGLGIFDQNLNAYQKMLARREVSEDAMKDFLKGKIYNNRVPGKLFLRKTRGTENVLNLFCDSFVWEVQKEIVNHCFLFRRSMEKMPVTIALWQGGCRRLSEHYSWIRSTCAQGRAVLVLDITGMGMLEQRQFLAWTDADGFYGAKFKLNADMLWLGDCLMALGCFDLLRSLDAAAAIRGLEIADIELYTWGKHSLYGEIASFLDARIRKVTCEYPQKSFEEVVERKYYDPTDMASFVMPGILKYGDMEDIRKWRKSE